MKKCPMCAEAIQDEALKCRFCGEMLGPGLPPPAPVPSAPGGPYAPGAAGSGTVPAAPWFFRSGSLVFAFLCVGPFMLPLIWLHPSMSREKKATWTAVIVLVSAALIWSSWLAVQRLLEYYKLIGGALSM